MAKHDKLDLSIAKAERNTDFLVLKYGSTERGKVVDVTVKDVDGLPYNLNGLDLYFVEELYNGQMIVDDGKQENAGKFITIDLENGKFSYQFPENIYQYDGWAHFKFMKGSNLIDTTAGFTIKIIDDIDSDLDEKSYVAYFENIKKEHQAWLDKTKELLASAQDLNSYNHQMSSEVQNLKNADENLKQEIAPVNWKIVDGVNADTITYTSKLFIKNASNIPEDSGGLWGFLITDTGSNDPARITQEWWSDGGSSIVGQTSQHYYRQKNGTQSWPSWVKQATQNDVDNLTKKISDNADAITKKANSAEVYTKSELDPMIAPANWKIVDNINADTVNYTSKLFIRGVSGIPVNSGGFWGYLITGRIQADDTTRVTQEWWSDGGSTVAEQAVPHYYRQITSNNMIWSPWVKQLTPNDIDSLASRISALEKKIEGR